MVVENYTFIMADGDRPTVYRNHGNGFVEIGQASSAKHGYAIVEELNRIADLAKSNTDLRERVIQAVNDAIEECFEGDS